MLRMRLDVLAATIGLAALCATPARANYVTSANATMTCSTYNISFTTTDLTLGEVYRIDYEIDASPTATGFPISGSSVNFTAASGTTAPPNVPGSFPALNGSYAFTGSATLYNVTEGYAANTIISTNPYAPYVFTFSPTSLTCAPPPPPPCSAQSNNSSNFNGTSVPSGDYIWFNANFTASGIPASGATITLTNSTISFEASGQQYNLLVPNAQITFSPSATCTSTTFNTMTNTWITTVPVKGDDEIFLTGLTWPVPSSGLPGGVNPVDWTGTFGTNGTPGVTIQWKWGAAAYSNFTTNYNALNVKAGHQTACGMSNGDHAGTPEGVNNSNQPWKNFVVGGARGGGGSEWTGSWSSTKSASPLCQ